ncbi:DUF2207 domain-containing protein [Thermomonospora cellulosilytica]|uniref:DUF2207 domain-containing protein n=1 Tax=Thermomonospora cellulosilytica TaxID=1411118 RepID=A0A7W3N590_9ACTN|nr:DUF2207 domain-containing protein [Thermomonospora cellulosilytica]MBA9007717.1 hypothetical protein [Thermomonospora cellulosilytica]
MRRVLWAMAVAVGVSSVVAPFGLPASAAVTGRVTGQGQATAGPAPHAGESIPTYDVVLRIRSDGVVRVRETITYDFQGRKEHGIVRRVPYRIDNRLYGIRNVRTSSSTGAPARAEASRMLHEVRIRVGGRHRMVSGRQAYVIEYDVTGAMTPLPGRVEFRWDAIGTGWDVPIGEVSVRVELPGPAPLKVTCRAGAAGHGGYTRCGGRREDGPSAIDFTQSGLRPHESVLIRAVLPQGAVQAPPPRYARPHFDASWPGRLLFVAGVVAALAVASAGRTVRASRLPARWTGMFLAVTGTLAVGVDIADDVLAHDMWAVSIGDPALAGLGALGAGAALLITIRRRRTAERETVEDQRA